MSQVHLPQTKRIDVLKNMLLSLEEGNLLVRDFKGTHLLTLGSGLCDFCASEDKIITFSSTEGMKVYDLFSSVHQLIPRLLGKERGVQFEYQFPNAFLREGEGKALPIGYHYIYFGSGLIHYETGKVWTMKGINPDVAPVMLDKDRVAYQAGGKIVLYHLYEGKKVEIPCEREVVKLGADKKYLFIMGKDRHLSVWDTRNGQIKEAKKAVGEKTYRDFIIGDQDTGILAIQDDGVTPFWEDGGAYERDVPVHVMEFSANNG